MQPRSIDFYFDYISPFAHFAWRNITPLAKRYDCQIHAHPVVFGKLLDKWGQLGPAEITPKRKWLHQYCLRYAALNGFAYNPPKFHPFNPLAALRMSLKEVSGNEQHQVIDAIFEEGWCHGKDLGDLPTLVTFLEERAIDGDYLSRQIALPNVKQSLVEETNMAINRGVFGVPCMIVDGLLFWGNDQMEHIELLLSGKDPLDQSRLDTLERPRAIDRKTFNKLD